MRCQDPGPKDDNKVSVSGNGGGPGSVANAARTMGTQPAVSQEDKAQVPPGLRIRKHSISYVQHAIVGDNWEGSE